MVEWYVLHVQPGKEAKVTEIIKSKLSSKLYRPFIPYIEKYFRRAGITNREKRICFPGYVFIESQTTAVEFNKVASNLLFSIKEVYSVLQYGASKDEISMPKHEQTFLKRLLSENDCITASQGTIVDGKVQICSGALLGMEYAIKKIDRHKREAKIKVVLLGKEHLITVALEIVLTN